MYTYSGSDSSGYNSSSKVHLLISITIMSSTNQTSLSSLGSLLDVSSVANLFEPPRQTPHQRQKKSSQRASAKRSPNSTEYYSDAHPKGFPRHHSTSPDQSYKNRVCPHCGKVFSNSWATPRHVSVSPISLFLHSLTGRIILMTGTTPFPIF